MPVTISSSPQFGQWTDTGPVKWTMLPQVRQIGTRSVKVISGGPPWTCTGFPSTGETIQRGAYGLLLGPRSPACCARIAAD